MRYTLFLLALAGCLEIETREATSESESEIGIRWHCQIHMVCPPEAEMPGERTSISPPCAAEDPTDFVSEGARYYALRQKCTLYPVTCAALEPAEECEVPQWR